MINIFKLLCITIFGFGFLIFVTAVLWYFTKMDLAEILVLALSADFIAVLTILVKEEEKTNGKHE